MGLPRGMLVNGVGDPLAYVDALREFTLQDRASHIRCPTWVCTAEGDDISASAPQLVDALTCEKTYVRFTGAEAPMITASKPPERYAKPAPSPGLTAGCAQPGGRLTASVLHPDGRPLPRTQGSLANVMSRPRHCCS
jgi:hypothetical protein